MEMDDHDEKKLYEVTEMEMEQYQGNSQHEFKPTAAMSDVKTGLGFPRILIIVFFSLLTVVLLLNLILQSVTVYRLINDSDEAATSAADSGTVVGTAAPTICPQYNMNNTEVVLKKLDEFAGKLDGIMSSSEMQAVYIQNSSDSIEDNLVIAQQSAQKLVDIVRTLSSIKDVDIATEGIVTDILLVAQELLKIQNSSLSFQEPKSCQGVRNSQPNSPSGYYHINSQIVYCEMGELCGTDGGWTRLAYLDMSDSTQDCPEGFRLYEVGGVRACGRPVGGPGCASLKLPSNGISYSEVCGRVIGYHYGSADAVDTRFVTPAIHNDINSYYVDGVSITHGYPRNHIWTLMIGNSATAYSDGNCPCNTPPGGAQEVQAFVGNDYFCEAGSSFADDPVWDNEGCGPQELSCCSFPGLPWFNKTVNATTDYLELRVCADQGSANEDAPVGFYEIYVK